MTPDTTTDERSPDISILDYGMGNLRSVQKALAKIGYESRISSDRETLSNTDLLVVPGVGAFDKAVRNIRDEDLWDLVREHCWSGKPYLGICLGYQLLFERSEEGDREGFGLYEGVIRRFRDVKPVPHMGWNEVDWTGDGRSLHPEQVDGSPCYYFVHSYYPDPVDESIVAARTNYGSSFASAIRDENVYGVQFHPEKSQFAGLHLLKTICDESLIPDRTR